MKRILILLLMLQSMLLLMLQLLLAGCAAPPPPPAPLPAVDFKQEWYREARLAGREVFDIDGAQSQILITVRRGGTLARLGHDHVIVSRQLHGLVAPDQGRADFYFPVAELSVDEAPLRQAAGLDPVLPEQAIRETRQAMLGKVLEAERFPFVLLHAERVAGSDTLLRLEITLHGVSKTLEVPAQITRSQDSLSASGTLKLLQSDFGITQLSALDGALVVLDQLELSFQISARRTP